MLEIIDYSGQGKWHEWTTNAFGKEYPRPGQKKGEIEGERRDG